MCLIVSFITLKAQVKDTFVPQGRLYLNTSKGFKDYKKFTNLTIHNSLVKYTNSNGSIDSINISQVKEIDYYKKGDQRWLFATIEGGVALIASAILINRNFKKCENDPDCVLKSKTPYYIAGTTITVGAGITGYLLGIRYKKVKVIYFKGSQR